MRSTMMSRVVMLLLVLALCNAVVRGRNLTTILVFGDSTVDPGNNNGLVGAAKADFSPYGINFYGHQATGRFCDGRLATDFISELFGIAKIIPAFLDHQLQPKQLISGVSFASASSGYDLLTSTYADAISFPKQIVYLRHYKINLRRLVGPVKADQIIKNAVVLFSAGTNDIMANYYLYPDRPKQFTISEYADYLTNLVSNYIKEIHRLGITRFAIVGAPPIGCLPIIKFQATSDSCVSKFNNAAMLFNTKLVAQLAVLKRTLGLRIAYIDCFKTLVEVFKDPAKYGFLETPKGCCGSGTTEFGDTCKGLTTCKDPSTYVFFDAVHPTQKTDRLIAEEAMPVLVKNIL